MAAAAGYGAVANTGSDLYEQGGARDERAHRPTGGRGTGTIPADGHIPQCVCAHTAGRG